ncbi:transketolase C-terminal domain-containing protein, partial [Arthrospira platensis SPKY1]|nr:transketolase C-terminal domain-containing protein [Arthrospira platensis SPKY1]
ELRHMLATALTMDRPTALRYPRGNGYGVPARKVHEPLAVGRAQVLRQGADGLVWAAGTMATEALRAAERLATEGGASVTVVDARFVKPLDRELLASQVKQGIRVMTVEENALAGGFGSAVMEEVAALGVSGVAF